MDTSDKKQIERAFFKWTNRYYIAHAIDREVEPFLKVSQPKENFWLKKARTALFISSANLAEKLDMTRSAYAQLEESERMGSITLNSLKKIAEAMDCELVYAIRPKTKTLFAKIIWQTLMEKSLFHPWVKSRPQAKKQDALVAVANWTMKDPKFRKLQNWSQQRRISK